MNFRATKGVVIDAGHGGDDPGAVGNGIIEKNLNLEASEYMYNRLKELGIPVKIIRSTDETLSSTDRTKRILNAFGNSSDVIVISNHINAGGGDGAETIYALRNSDALAKSILEEIEKQGQNGRKYYQRRLPSDPSKDYYFIHRNTGVTQPVIVEYGFLDSKGDDVTQLKNNLLDYVEGVVIALANYTGTPYVAPEGSNIYVVQKGDSLWSIANKYGVTIDELKNANNLTSNILNVGTTLIIPEKKEEVPGEYSVYTVKSGDNLYNIASQFGVSVNDIIKLNNLDSTLLSVNQQLLIPVKEEELPGNVYTVKSGDSLWSIASSYGVTVDELIQTNGLTSNILSIGQQLYIPTEETVGENEYVVQKGDSLWSIANSHGITVDELKAANNLTSNVLSTGQVLTIPKQETSNINNIIYIVQKGDSLWSIAKKYNITVAELKEFNGLTSNSLSLNQELIIPQTEEYETYTVVSGDNLYNLAIKYNTTVDAIKTANNLTSNSLSIGQKLIIPA